MRAFYIKTNEDKLLGNEEAIFIFMTRQDARHRLETTEAEPRETLRIVEISVEEVQ